MQVGSLFLLFSFIFAFNLGMLHLISLPYPPFPYRRLIMCIYIVPIYEKAVLHTNFLTIFLTSICMHASTYIFIHTYILTYILTYLHTYIHTCIHTYIHTHILTYKQNYVHTHISILIYMLTHSRSGSRTSSSRLCSPPLALQRMAPKGA